MTMNATYSPEDNKLRLYAAERLDDDTYKRLKSAGFKWAAKQAEVAGVACLMVAPMWTPAREDLLLELVDEIGDEDYSPEERAADRAERFSGYRDKRAGEAGDRADRFDAGPSAFGHQNRQRAERQAARHDRLRVSAVSQWSKAEYWQQRTKGVIGHALFKSSAKVRRGRVLTIESDLRKLMKRVEESTIKYDAWQQVLTMEGADELLPLNASGYVIAEGLNPAQRRAYTTANVLSYWYAYHPTSEEANEECERLHHHGFSPYDFLTNTDFIGKPFERMTPRQFAEFYLAKTQRPGIEGSNAARWIAHYEFRLAYENAMLEQEGGTAAAVEMIPGGFIGNHQIYSINKSKATGRVTSVMIRGEWGFTKVNGKSVYVDHANASGLAKLNIERLGEDVYRAPTEEELAAFHSKKKASKKPTISTYNPTDADAERFQLWLNQKAAEHAKSKGKQPSAPREIDRTTQKTFSYYNGGEGFYQISEYTIGEVTFKVRTRRRGFSDYYAADSVLILTDKPQKPLPIDWELAFATEAEPAPAGQLF